MHLVSKTINYIIHCRAKGTLIVPKWKSATYWPSLVNLKGDFLGTFIVGHIEYKNPKDLFTVRSEKNSILPYQHSRVMILVFRIDAS